MTDMDVEDRVTYLEERVEVLERLLLGFASQLQDDLPQRLPPMPLPPKVKPRK
jgi:hypothetical protein